MSCEPTDDRVWVEIDASSEPIAGIVRRGADPARPFAGWLELVALLESERRTGGDPCASGE
jgi:hypothetical protein